MLILIVVTDLAFDSIFNIWIEFLGISIMNPKAVGRICQSILLVQIYLLVAVYRLQDALRT